MPTPIATPTEPPTFTPTPEDGIGAAEFPDELYVELEHFPDVEFIDGSFRVKLYINVSSDPDTPFPEARSVSVLCQPTGSEARQCADEWRLVQTTPHESWSREFTISVPAGWTDIVVTEDGVPLGTYGLNVEADQRLGFSHFGYPMLYYRSEIENREAFSPMDVYISESVLPEWSNGLSVRNLGYRSDGSVTLEVFGANRVLRPGDTVSCGRTDGISALCNGQLQQLPGGLYSKFVAQLPVGTTTITVNRAGQTVVQADLTVSERIMGVPKQVLDCFTDTTFEDASFTPDWAIGCGGWFNPYVIKWDTDRPVRIKLSGPTQWTSLFAETLTELQPLFNLEFEWVTDEAVYDLEAIVGITHEQSLELGIACSEGPTTGGCASAGISVGGAEQHITIYNLYQELSASGNLPTSESQLGQIRSTILHEAVHAFTGMGHRIETGTLMHSEGNEFSWRRPAARALSPMDREMVKLHAHPLVQNGMTFAELRRIVVALDDMLDPIEDENQHWHALQAWSIVDSAFHKLRDATTAQYVINTQLAGCDQRVTDAVYQVGNIRKSGELTSWARLSTVNTELYLIRNPLGEQDELWEANGGNWELANDDPESNGWLPELSDPYRLLLDVILFADWNHVTTVDRGQGTMSVETSIQTHEGRTADIRIDIDTESSVVTGYAVDRPTEDSECDGYRITATTGQFGNEFTWPAAIRTRSPLLDTCDITDLQLNPRAVRIAGRFNRECQTNGEHINSISFTTDRWSLLRIDLDTPHDVSAVIKGQTVDDATVGRSKDVRFPEGLAGYGQKTGDERAWQFDLLPHGAYLWHHRWLPPGSYQIDIVAPLQQFPGQYTMSVDTQPIPGDPSSLRFKAVATSTTRTCALTTDGTPLCWGRPTDSSEDPTIPVGPFDTIFGGYHFCALNADGSPQCWDFKEAGKHDCHETETSQDCSTTGQVVSSDEGLRGQASGTAAGRYYDQTPQPGETFAQLAPGRDHTCGLRPDGSVLCWGEGISFENQPSSDGPFSSVVGGPGFWCALNGAGTPHCQGSDYESTLPEEHSTFTELGISFTHGPYRMCGLHANGQAKCFGINQYCDPSEASIEPCFDVSGGDSEELRELYRGFSELVHPPQDSQFVALSSDGPDCGIRADGSVECWHQWGIVGSPPPTETFTAVSSGKYHVCGLRADGTIACWGDNGYGQSTPPNGTYLGQFR